VQSYPWKEKIVLHNSVLLLGDAEKIIPHIESAHLIMTSPPYDALRDYGGHPFNFSKFKCIARLLKSNLHDGGIIVWIVNDQTIDCCESLTSFKQAIYFKSLGLNIHDTMIYKKNGSAFPSKVRYSACFEFMFIISKGKPKTFNPIQDRKNMNAGIMLTSTERKKDGSIVNASSNGKAYFYKDYSIRNNIWKYEVGFGKSSKDPLAFSHPAVFPDQLANDHIFSWSNPGDVVLDPMMGSGTTGVACAKFNRKFIGIEIEEEYFQLAHDRIKRGYEQLNFNL
jgi:site-specific DNA-methyltransferase (adenine-specific)